VLRYLFLALLGERARHGYELKAAFEEVLGGTWPLNVGQVYTGLAKLEADGLVLGVVVAQELVPDKKVYSLTETGRKELERWLEEEDEPPVRPRDEMFLKVLAQSLGGNGTVAEVVRRQRHGYMQALGRLTKQRSQLDLHDMTALLLDGAILRAEADLKWLDLCETRIQDRRQHRRATRAVARLRSRE
jgi:DNA-binding PadR family transcriptional regulator